MNHLEGLKYLESKGINIFHAFNTDGISDVIESSVPHLTLSEYPSTILIANAGPKFWNSMQVAGFGGVDPVDNYSIFLAQRYASEYLVANSEILYPSDYPISLREIGSRTGWSFPSPIGITIHPRYGTWYAYRALFLVNTQIPATPVPNMKNPCDICDSKPCQSVCPVTAVGDIGAFDLDGCARFRIEDESPCSYQCISRNACPIGTEFRYTTEQMKYHYSRSRVSMSKYYATLNT